MERRKIYMTAADHERLSDLLMQAAEGPVKVRADLADLAAEIKSAHILGADRIPATLVTMNSKVRLRDLSNDETMVYTLVFPEKADIDQGNISVLSPVGTAILGYSESDTIDWQVPDGVRRLKIEAVIYQPEAAGVE